jgi:hypothetical protein
MCGILERGFMSANKAKYLLTLAGVEPQHYQVTGFVGEDAIDSPYWFDVEFSMSDAAKAVKVVPPDAGVLGKGCRLDMECNGKVVSYTGIAGEFRVGDSGVGEAGNVYYSVRLAPRMHLLTLNFSSRVFQNRTVPAGGWKDGAYTCRNEFTGVRAEEEIYAPPLRTPIPRIDGVTTAPVGATGDTMPTIDKIGRYNVNMPFVLKDKKGDANRGSYDYGGSKAIRVAQPSGGMSDGEPYGMHFPSKRGAEMVLAYVDGNPDRPVGLGFVPNVASLSVVRNTNNVENVMRSWGGNELVMTDTVGNKKVILSTPEKRYLELYDGKKLVRVKSEHCEMLFNDGERFALIDAGGHIIRVNYAEDSGRVSVTTVNGATIDMDDAEDIITLQTAAEKDGKKTNLVVLNGRDEAITLDSKDNTVVLNGKEAKITMESKDSKVAIDGKEEKIAMENKDAKVAIDGGQNTITLATQKVIIDAKKAISLKTGGKIIFDAKGGIFNKSLKQNLED